MVSQPLLHLTIDLKLMIQQADLAILMAQLLHSPHCLESNWTWVIHKKTANCATLDSQGVAPNTNLRKITNVEPQDVEHPAPQSASKSAFSPRREGGTHQESTGWPLPPLLGMVMVVLNDEQG